MRVVVVHGYFLHDSGSGIYVRELARALVRLGHEVTLVCQDREPERCVFIDSSYVLDAANTSLSRIYEAPRSMPGSCRLVRPDIGGELLVYVDGEFPPFTREHVHAYQSASVEARDLYVARNVVALRTVFDEWPPELVLAQHIIMQPFAARRALAGRAPYVMTEHGSALNFSVRANDALVPFALEGLAGAVQIATVSQAARDDLVAWATEHALSIAEKTVAMPPGIDGDLFSPAASREAALTTLAQRIELPAGFEIAADDDVVAFAGALRPNKGIQHLLAALPLVARLRGRRILLLIAGDGPARRPLDELAAFIAYGDLAAARRVVASEPQLQSPPLWGDVLLGAPEGAGDERVAFLGHVEHEQLAAVFAAADVCVVPSVLPEAAALVNVEGLAAGAVPVTAHHSGMVDLNDHLADALGDPWFADLTPGPDYTRRLAEHIAHALDAYPTKDTRFRHRLHDLALSRYPTWGQTASQYIAMAR